MIKSFIKGRVRLRSEALKDAKIVAEIVEFLKAEEGILSLDSNVRTGSLLVNYDPDVISEDHLKFAAATLADKLKVSESSSQCCSNKLLQRSQKNYNLIVSRKTERFVLFSSFILCLVGLLGPKKLHLVGGTAFTVLAAKHIYNRRKLLYPKI